jgi:hypothetical protein
MKSLPPKTKSAVDGLNDWAQVQCQRMDDCEVGVMIAEAQAILRTSAKDWTDVVVAVAAVAALIVALISLKVSSRALRLSEKQEQRKQPRLVPSLLESHFANLTEGGRVYSFSLSVVNPTDSDNAIAQIEMHLRYLIDGDVSMTVKLPLSSVDICYPAATDHPRLMTPSRIAAHDTAFGWCDFVVKPGILSGRTIEGYQIVLTDSHQAETSIEPLVVSEKRHVV